MPIKLLNPYFKNAMELIKVSAVWNGSALKSCLGNSQQITYQVDCRVKRETDLQFWCIINCDLP